MRTGRDLREHLIQSWKVTTMGSSSRFCVLALVPPQSTLNDPSQPRPPTTLKEGRNRGKKEGVQSTREEKQASRLAGLWTPAWDLAGIWFIPQHLAGRETPLSPVPIRAKEQLFTACYTETSRLQSLSGRTGFCGTSATVLVLFSPLHQGNWLQVSNPALQTLTGNS